MLNQSIFNLIENPNELPSSNENMAELFYREILPVRDLTDSATDAAFSQKFGGSPISLRWNFDNRTWWIPSRSYFKLDIEITKAGQDGDASESLDVEDQIAPNMGLAASLINRMHFKMNDTTVCQISQYIPQVDALCTRIFHSSEWLSRNVGNDVNYWEPSHKARLHMFTQDGCKSSCTLTHDRLDQQTVFPQPDAFDQDKDDPYRGYDYISANRSELGLGPNANEDTIGFTIDAGTMLMSFQAIGNINVPDMRKKFEFFDLIILRIERAAGVEGFPRAFHVFSVKNKTQIKLATLTGQPLPGDIDDAGNLIRKYDITRLRHATSIKAQLGYRAAMNSNTALYTKNNDSTFTFSEQKDDKPQAVSLEQGDWIIVPNSANDANGIYIPCSYFNFETNYEMLHTGIVANEIEVQLSVSNGVTTASNAAMRLLDGDRPMYYVKTNDQYRWKDLISLGFNFPLTNDSTAFLVDQNSLILTKTEDDDSNNNEFSFTLLKVGDIIVLQNAAGYIASFYVAEETDDDDEVQLCSSTTLNANFGANDNGNNTLVGIFFYSPQRKENEYIKESKNKARFDLIWKPNCLSIFNYPGAIPGGVKFELELQALAGKYSGLGVETPFGVNKIARQTANPENTDYQLLIKGLKYYVCHVQGPIVGAGDYCYYLNLNEVRAHNRRITAANLVQTTIDVMPSSYALALAFQDVRADDSQQTQFSNTKFHVNDQEELALTRYSLRFAGLSLPQPDAELKSSDQEEKLFNYYMRNQIYTNQYYKSSAGESYAEWKERGIYWYHPFIRSAGNRETRAYVITEFNTRASQGKVMSQTGLDNLRMLLFEFYRAFAMIKMRNGSVYDVKTANQ